MKESEVREMLAHNKHVKILKGSLESRFDPYLLSVRNRVASTVASDDQQNAPNRITKLNREYRSTTEGRMAERLTAAHSLWKYEPITLCISRVGNRKTTYTPDFLVVEDGQLTFIEVKGAFVREKGILKFKMACAEFSDIFNFECWQWKNDAWTCILQSL